MAGAFSLETVPSFLSSPLTPDTNPALSGGAFKLGLESGVSVGSIGEGGTAGLDVVSFASSKGAFLGMSLAGFSINALSDANETYYGTPVKPEQILANGPITNPGADELRAAVSRATR